MFKNIISIFKKEPKSSIALGAGKENLFCGRSQLGILGSTFWEQREGQEGKGAPSTESGASRGSPHGTWSPSQPRGPTGKWHLRLEQWAPGSGKYRAGAGGSKIGGIFLIERGGGGKLQFIPRAKFLITWSN